MSQEVPRSACGKVGDGVRGAVAKGAHRKRKVVEAVVSGWYFVLCCSVYIKSNASTVT